MTTTESFVPADRRVPPLAFPTIFITAPDPASKSDGEPRLAVFPLETAPIPAFNAWLNAILDAEEGIADPLFLFTIRGHRESWDVIARWWLINALALHSVDIRRYYFESVEQAEEALRARNGQ